MHRAADRRPVEALAEIPGPPHIARGQLQVAPRQVIADGVAPDVVQRLRLVDIGTATADRDHQLGLVVQVFGLRRIRDLDPATDHRVGRLGKEKRRFAVGVLAHFPGVLGVVAPDAEDAPYREACGRVRDGDGGPRGRVENVIGHVRPLDVSGNNVIARSSSDEAISETSHPRGDCFAALAMTKVSFAMTAGFSSLRGPQGRGNLRRTVGGREIASLRSQ